MRLGDSTSRSRRSLQCAGTCFFQFCLQKLQSRFARHDRGFQGKIGQTTILQAYSGHPGRPLAVEVEKSVRFKILQRHLSGEVLSHIPPIGNIRSNFNLSAWAELRRGRTQSCCDPDLHLAALRRGLVRNELSKPFFGNFSNEIEHRLVDFPTYVKMLQIGKLLFEVRINRLKQV